MKFKEAAAEASVPVKYTEQSELSNSTVPKEGGLGSCRQSPKVGSLSPHLYILYLNAQHLGFAFKMIVRNFACFRTAVGPPMVHGRRWCCNAPRPCLESAPNPNSVFTDSTKIVAINTFKSVFLWDFFFLFNCSIQYDGSGN